MDTDRLFGYCGFASRTTALTSALDQLVAADVSAAVPEDETDALQMLSKFRDRLLKSLEHVERAIASLPED